AAAAGGVACRLGIRARSGSSALSVRRCVLLSARRARSLYGPLRGRSPRRNSHLLALDLDLAFAVVPRRAAGWRDRTRIAHAIEAAGGRCLRGARGSRDRVRLALRNVAQRER